jgi:small-conductance mechanosensitive channel
LAILSYLAMLFDQDNLAENLMDKTKGFFLNVYNDPVSFFLMPLGEIILILVLTVILVRMFRQIIDKTFSVSRINNSQANTLRSLIKSVVTYTIYFISILTILSVFGINLGPILAGAGILGLAIGFGAQNLVKDVISGFFLIFERQLEVGDLVQINAKVTGTVEEVGLRITKIREYNQRLHYFANRTIIQVTNYNREKMRAIVPFTFPFDTDVSLVNKSLSEAAEKVKDDFKEELIEPPEVLEYTNLDQSGIQFTIHAVCNPDAHTRLERGIRKRAYEALLQNNIEIAQPSPNPPCRETVPDKSLTTAEKETAIEKEKEITKLATST